jgi:hypothetical protein
MQAIHYAGIAKHGNVYTKADSYMKLLKLARRLSTIDVHYCNGTKTDMQWDKTVNSIIASLKDLLAPDGLYFYHQSDPRGASLYIAEMELSQANYTNALAIY